MLRISPSILGGSDTSPDLDGQGVSITATIDADLILTAAVLGFTAARIVVGNPVDFAYDEDSDHDINFLAVNSIRNALLGNSRVPMSKEIVEAVGLGKTRPWTEAALITGAVGAANTPFERRNAVPTATEAEELRRLAASLTEPVGYQGRGAYTGLVDDPFGSAGSISSTARFNAPTNDFGERWAPPSYKYSEGGLSQANAPWGLINDGADIPGMVIQAPEIPGVVGYTHGMIQAIYTSVAKGPWCTPFEIAVGRETTKLASCFPCTLFMYAAGYPASAIHLGRGDSWLPFYPKDSTSHQYSMMADEGIRSTNTRWQLECWQVVRLGREILSGLNLPQQYQDRLEALAFHLESRSADPFAASNLFLDALTIPGKFYNRIANVIPANLEIYTPGHERGKAMGSPREIVSKIDPSSTVGKEQRELLNALTALAESKRDTFVEMISHSLRTADTEENKTLAISAIEETKNQIHVYTSTAPAETIPDAVKSATKGFLDGGAENIVGGILGLVSAFATSFLGSGTAGAASDSTYTVYMNGVSLSRVDLYAWSYTLQDSGLLENMQSISVFVYCKSTIDVQQLNFQTFLNKYNETCLAAASPPTVDAMLKEIENVRTLYDELRKTGLNRLPVSIL